MITDKPISEMTDDELRQAIAESNCPDGFYVKLTASGLLRYVQSSNFKWPISAPVPYWPTLWESAEPLMIEMYDAGFEPVLETGPAGFSLRYEADDGQQCRSAWVSYGARAGLLPAKDASK